MKEEVEDFSELAEHMDTLIKLASNGDVEMQLCLAVMYQEGVDGKVERSCTEAFRWYLAAAKNGDARAQYLVGGNYLNGANVLQNMEEAAKWYKLAAEQNLAEAQFSLASLYIGGFVGNKTDEEIKEASYWLLRAANQGFQPAIDFINKVDK